MKVSRTTVILRSILGLIFLVFGLNHFVPFLPQPPMSGPAGALIGAFVASGYILGLVSGTQVVAGAMLVAGIFVPLALLLLAPEIVNILAFHIYLDPAGIGPGIVVTVLELILAWQYRAAFAPLFR